VSAAPPLRPTGTPAATGSRAAGEPGSIDLLILSSVHWHFTWQRHHEIATRLSERGYRVTFFEPLPKRWPRAAELGRVWGRLSGHHEKSGTVRQRVPAGVHLRHARALPDTAAWCRAFNRAVTVPRAARALGRELDRPLVVLHYLPLPAAIALARRLRPDLAIYDCVWDWPHDPYSRPGVIREESLLAEVDLVFADSPYLFERMRQAHGRVHRVLPAVDYELYAPARAGSSAPRPVRCAYFGALGANIDRSLVARLSREFALRLIGPVQEPLPGLAPATEVLGPVPQAELPALLADVDVLVLPYREAAHSEGVIPAKTFECLATGKPVVAKGLASLAEFRDAFRLATDDESFVRAVREAVDEGPGRRERRLELARRNTWRERAEQIDALVRQALAEKAA
jgi:glycosyltransferase involved in cell wall biosynthesis